VRIAIRRKITRAAKCYGAISRRARVAARHGICALGLGFCLEAGLREANEKARSTDARILIVDDDEDARETLRHLLERSGYTVAAAENGRQALDLLRAGTVPCLVLLDLRMPVMDGWAFLSALELDRTLASIPIVVVSAARTETLGGDAVKGVISKPIDMRRLLATVRQHCGAPESCGPPQEGAPEKGAP
jgi:CheY-like chemotaxis protein